MARQVFLITRQDSVDQARSEPSQSVQISMKKRRGKSSEKSSSSAWTFKLLTELTCRADLLRQANGVLSAGDVEEERAQEAEGASC